MKLINLLLCLSTLASLGASKKPNILMILADQVRWDILGTYGNPATSTPNIDKLAQQGVQFEKAYSSTPICTPARAALLTGMKPWNNGMMGYGKLAVKYKQEMITALKEDLGYYAAMVGKNHFGWNRTAKTGVSHGFDHMVLCDGTPLRSSCPDLQYAVAYEDDYNKFFDKAKPGVCPVYGGLDMNTWWSLPFHYDEDLHQTAYVGSQTVKLIEDYDFENGKPLFLKSSFFRPHSPYDPPQRLIDQIDPDKIKPHFAGGNWDEKYRKNPSCTGDFAWCGEFDAKEVNNTKRAYHANVNFIDEQVGKIYKALEQKGVADNTIIMFTTDHGDMQSDHYLWRKGFPFEGSSHIPMILSWPKALEGQLNIKMEQGTKSKALTELRDVFPTFYHAAGGDLSNPKYSFDGTSLLKLLQDPSSTTRDWLDLGMDINYHGQNMTGSYNGITDGRYKYSYYAFHGNETLFDLDTDPEENNDIASENPQLVKKYRDLLIQHFQSENRGSKYLKNGKLARRFHIILYSPNMPEELGEIYYPYDYDEDEVSDVEIGSAIGEEEEQEFLQD